MRKHTTWGKIRFTYITLLDIDEISREDNDNCHCPLSSCVPSVVGRTKVLLLKWWPCGEPSPSDRKNSTPKVAGIKADDIKARIFKTGAFFAPDRDVGNFSLYQQCVKYGTGEQAFGSSPRRSANQKTGTHVMPSLTYRVPHRHL